MPRAQRAARLRQVRAAKKHLRDDAEDRPQAASARRAQSLLSPAGILRLQHAIGNRAVQRLVVQRQPSRPSKPILRRRKIFRGSLRASRWTTVASCGEKVRLQDTKARS
jgi:hypothetical protein